MNEEQVFEEIKSVIDVISILQSRENALREELEFFKQKWKDISEPAHKIPFVGASKRLEHEAMFLCIEVYSLYKGIAKQRSLYSKVIKQNGKLLSKIDKTPRDENTYEWLDIICSDGKKDFTNKEKNDFMQKLNEEAYRSRKKIRDNSGITSSNHDEIGKLLNQVLDKDTLKSLGDYRDKFAHRLDSLENLKLELKPSDPNSVAQVLDVVSTVLNTYMRWLQGVLVYTKSEQRIGITFEYDSLSRLKVGGISY